MKRILILPGDGIGPEVCAAAEEVLRAVAAVYALDLDIAHGVIGGGAIDADGTPLSDATLAQARSSDAVLLGAVGGPRWDPLPLDQRPERGLLRLRSELGLYANLRPALVFPQLVDASSLKPELVRGLDILIVRELNGGIYFGEPRGVGRNAAGEVEAFNTCRYSEPEIERIARRAFEAAQQRSGRLCSIDKANVLEVTRLWRDVFTRIGESDYPQVELNHLYVDNAAMQLVREPRQFDVIAADNMFGDILSDQAAMLTGSIGMLPSASLSDSGVGLYEPCHGSAPDIAGTGSANPLAMILSMAMMLRHSLNEPGAAQSVEQAVTAALEEGLRTVDIAGGGDSIDTQTMARAVARLCA